MRRGLVETVVQQEGRIAAHEAIQSMKEETAQIGRRRLRDYHFDGLRIDAIHAIFDSSAVHFLEQLATEVKELEAHTRRCLVLIAESDLNDPRVVTPREAGGYGIDAQWSDDFHHALHALLTGERAGYYADFGTLADVAKALTSAFVYDGR